MLIFEYNYGSYDQLLRLAEVTEEADEFDNIIEAVHNNDIHSNLPISWLRCMLL